MSDVAVTARPCACSGDRYWAVPSTEPVAVISGAGARDSEVGHPRAPFAVDEHVLRLEVAVDDARACANLAQRTWRMISTASPTDSPGRSGP